MKAVLIALVAALPAAAQDRPGEGDMFGGAPSEAATETAPPPALEPEAAWMPEREASGEVVAENPLTIGGRFYLRSQASAAKGVKADKWALSAPWLVDGYFDARPNERLRGFLLARMRYDPTLDPNAPGGLGPAPDPGPAITLDQLWLRFDLFRTVFVTAGKQHVKWGTGRFWNPTDYLHPVRRDPLAVFDARSGATMLKLHAPIESLGWNFYAFALLDNPNPANTLGRVAGAARAELVLGPAELGLDAIFRKGIKPRYGVDLSAGVGPIDVYGELAIRFESDVPHWSLVEPPNPFLGVEGVFKGEFKRGFTPAATVGASWSYQYSDKDFFTLGVEYFYNDSGYDHRGAKDALLYPWLLYLGQFTPFYLGKHYAGAFFMLPAPGEWNNTTFVLSNLGNLSDKSWVSRLDYLVTVLTHLRVEAFAQAHYGPKGGELKLAIDIPEINFPGVVEIPRILVPPPLFEVGLGLRIDI